MRRNQDEEKITSRNNYCLKCWTEFTTMTPEEHKSFQEMMEHMGSKNRIKIHEDGGCIGKAILCNETNIVYKSISSCAKAIGSNIATLSRHLSYGTPASVKGNTFNYYVERII